jgi:hypothetical protein
MRALHTGMFKVFAHVVSELAEWTALRSRRIQYLKG